MSCGVITHCLYKHCITREMRHIATKNSPNIKIIKYSVITMYSVYGEINMMLMMIYDLSNGTILNDLERPQSWFQGHASIWCWIYHKTIILLGTYTRRAHGCHFEHPAVSLWQLSFLFHISLHSTPPIVREVHRRNIFIPFVREQEVKVIWQGGRNLYHWIPGVEVPISVP